MTNLDAFIRAVSAAVHALLLEKGHVVLPGWGALLTSPRRARFDRLQSVYFPPGVRISFTPLIVADDGELFALLHREWGWSLDDIASQWHHFIKSWKETILGGGVVHLADVGSFRRDADGRVVFHPLPDATYRLETWMLPPISVRPTKQKAASHQPLQQLMSDSPKREWMQIAAVWVMAILGFWLIEQGLPRLSPQPAMAGFAWETEQDRVSSPNLEDEVSETPPQAVDSGSVVASPTDSENEFLLIAASYARRLPAQRAARQFQQMGFRAEVIEGDGRFRVVLVSTRSESEARQLLPFFRKKLGRPDIWVLRRPIAP